MKTKIINIKGILPIIIGAVIIIIIIYFFSIDKYLYKGPIDKTKYISLLQDSLHKKTRAIGASANKQEAFYFLKLSDSLNIMIWQIDGFSEINPVEILVKKNQMPVKPEFSTYFERTLEEEGIYFLWEGKFLKAKSLQIALSKKDKINDLKTANNFLNLRFKLQRLILRDQNDDALVYMQATYIETDTELLFYRTSNSFLLFILTSIHGNLGKLSIFDILDSSALEEL